MNANEEFKKLKDFVAEFREEIKSQQRELDNLKRNLENQQRELDDKQKYLDLLEMRLNRMADFFDVQNSQFAPTPAQKNFVNQSTRYSSTQDNFQTKSTLPTSTTQRNLESYPSTSSRPNQQFQNSQITPLPAQKNFVNQSTRYGSTQDNFQQKSTLPMSTAQRNFESRSQANKIQSTLTPESITAEFNALANVQDKFTLKTLRDEFVQKYSVRAFSCTNFEARMNEPVPQPQFDESENILSSEYWAINNKGNSFLVFPNVRQYTNNHHTARAMGEIFSSNFMAGKTYTKIFVQHPAVFECVGNIWKLKVKGKLRLE